MEWVQISRKFTLYTPPPSTTPAPATATATATTTTTSPTTTTTAAATPATSTKTLAPAPEAAASTTAPAPTSPAAPATPARNRLIQPWVPPSLYGHATTMLRDVIYISGGTTTNMMTPSGERQTLYMLDINKSQWRLSSAPPTPSPPHRTHHCCVMVNHEMYMHGGQTTTHPRTILSDMWIYDTTKHVWSVVVYNSQASPEPPPRLYGHTITYLNHRLYVYGGITHDEYEEQYSNKLYVYDIKQKLWTCMNKNMKIVPEPRAFHTCTLISNHLIVFGGRAEDCALSDLWSYDPDINEWTQCIANIAFPEIYNVSSPAARYGHTATSFHNQVLVIMGGWNGKCYFDDLHAYDLVLNKWNPMIVKGYKMPLGRAFHSMIRINTQLFMFGGTSSGYHLNDIWSLELATFLLAQERAHATMHGRYSKPVSMTPTGSMARIGIPNSTFTPGKLTSIASTSNLLATRHTNTSIHTDWNLSHFELKETLGTGSFGRVRLCQHITNKTYYAMKILKKSEILRLKQVEHVMNEKSILCQIRHPFVVNLVSYFQDPKYLYLVMEYIGGGEFFSYLRRVRRFNDSTAQFYAAHIVLIFQYLHSKDIIYRDLKPENLLLDAKGHLKITDFGFAKTVEYRTWTLCGTPEYIAPEILLNKGHGKAVDWWALGILIYEMLAGSPPFVDDSAMGIYQKILAGKIKYPSYFTPHAIDLISQLLQPDITKRVGNMKQGAMDIIHHPWFKSMNWQALYRYELPAPYIPDIKGEADTSHFDKYPESAGTAQPITLPDDPFKNF